MGRRQTPKLNEIKIPLDEPKGKLFPRPKKAKSNFGKTVLTENNKRARVGLLGSVKQTSNKKSVDRKAEMKHVLKAEQVLFALLLATLSIYGVYQYTNGDPASVSLGAILVIVALQKVCK